MTGITRKRRFINFNRAEKPLKCIAEYFGFNDNIKTRLLKNGNGKKGIDSNIALYIVQNFQKISSILGKTNKKLDLLLDAEKKLSLTKQNIIALEYGPEIYSTNPKSQVDFFSFRLKDLSINYHLNSISPNLLRTSLEKENNKPLLTETGKTETPNFLRIEKSIHFFEKPNNNSIEKTLDNVTNNAEQNVFFQNLNNKIKITSNEAQNNYPNFNPNYKRKKTFENYKIVKNEISNNHNKSANDIILKKEDKPERKLSLDNDNVGESILNDNNSFSNGSEIDILRRDFSENCNIKTLENNNLNNISVSNLEAEKTCSEVSSSNNYSIQESGSNYSQEKFKKIRGFNFKNNVNTKKFCRQNVQKTSSAEKNVEASINNSSIINNYINETNSVQSQILPPEKEVILRTDNEKVSKLKKFNFHNNNINLKRYKASSSSLNNNENPK